MNTEEFKELVWQRGKELYRDMPWRQDTRPYYVLVSELMLQQTQVERVVPKFKAFVSRFPNEKALARASLMDVLMLWNGLGYNRRAKFLHGAAKMIMGEYGGMFPDTYEQLLRLPGVGKGTAGAIMTYTYNKPSLFIETNVRTVYFYHFFSKPQQITDAELMLLLEQTIDHEQPREFYWALMDYGTWLKKQGAGRISRSSHYRKQSALKGSVREVRGEIIRRLINGKKSRTDLNRGYERDARFGQALDGLVRDGLIVQTGEYFHLTK